MDQEQGKVFVGGISWETTEERLMKHFEGYGDVVEARIMKDKSTGRSRGFGFLIFSDSAVADKVVQEKHTIDGRMVEAKKAVPREDQLAITRTNSGGVGSILQTITRKVFVGGLASTVTENDFREYFRQFGTIVDAVVMYDQTTQRPRGFGFVTYELEDAVDRVMKRTFHELKGKVVEVKKAIPKEPSTATSRSFASELSMAMSRGGNFGCGFGQGWISNLEGNFGGKLNVTGGHAPGGTGVFLPCSTYSSGGYEIGGGYRPSLAGSYGDRGFGNNPANGGLDRYTGINAGNGGFSSPTAGRSMWSNGGIFGWGITGNSTSYGVLCDLDKSCFGGFQPWDSTPRSPTVASLAIGGSSGYSSGSHGFGTTESSCSSVAGGHMQQGGGFGFKDLKWKLNAPKSRPLPIGYGLSRTVADGLASHSGPHGLTGRQTNTGVTV